VGGVLGGMGRAVVVGYMSGDIKLSHPIGCVVVCCGVLQCVAMKCGVMCCSVL